MLDTTNCTPNHRWHVAHDIRIAIGGMDSLDKTRALVRIQSELLKGETPDPEVLAYVTSLLNDKVPAKGISRR